MKSLRLIVIFSMFIFIAPGYANLPLPNVVPDVGPGGPLVTAMRGMNTLNNEMLQTKILRQQLAMMQQQQAMDQADQKEIYAQQNMAKTVEDKIYYCLEHNAVGHSCYWRHPRLGNRLTITPIRNVTYNGNKNCRNYRLIIQTQNEKTQVTNLACRLSRGRWVRID